MILCGLGFRVYGVRDLGFRVKGLRVRGLGNQVTQKGKILLVVGIVSPSEIPLRQTCLECQGDLLSKYT